MFRIARIIILGFIIWSVIQVSQTTPYLGLSFEPKPVDCYESMPWNGKNFIHTGKFFCIKD
jgi:hypothetical protein